MALLLLFLCIYFFIYFFFIISSWFIQFIWHRFTGSWVHRSHGNATKNITSFAKGGKNEVLISV